jgi:CRISPR/Cas system-associated exonuclease Cas4 (RecB family)
LSNIDTSNITFSYSNINSFSGCKYGWYQTYIERVVRDQSSFGQFGSFCHKILEKYFRNELESWELQGYYTDNYSTEVTESFPPYPQGMASNYYHEGLDFFTNFNFDKSNYEIISIEEKLNINYKGYKFVAIPDMILKNNKTGYITLLDYKTSKLKNPKYDKAKLKGYADQLQLYAQFYWWSTDIAIDKIFLWFIRNNQFFEIKVNALETIETLSWLDNILSDIQSETTWDYNNKNKYFCQWLCSIRSRCPYTTGDCLA